MCEKVIASIYFDTSGTSYAFIFFDSKDDIIFGKRIDTWDIKNSTEIILNKKLETVIFLGN